MTNVKPMNHIHHLGLDEMEIYATFLYEELLIGVDFDNSNQFFIGDYTCIKVENPRYEYQIIFSKENINLFSYFKGSKGKSKIETKDYVVFYGSCFRVHGKDFVFDTLLSFFRLSDMHIFRRFDICVDFLLPISTILSKFKERGQKGADFYGSRGEIETEYIGEKKNSKNRRSIIRIYNKKADILAKGKNKLYQDYLLRDYVTRIELEIRRDLAKNYTLEELLVDENLLGIMKNYLGTHTSIFDGCEGEKITLYRKPHPVDYGTIQAYGSSLLRVRMFLGHARGLLERGLCPVYALLDKEIIDPKTYDVLINSGNFVQIMREIKIRSEHWKEIMAAIKDKSDAQR